MVFRTLTSLVGVFMVYASLTIYRRTQGGSKGWLFVAVGFLFLVVWTIADSVVYYLMFNEEASIVFGGIMYTVTGLCMIAPFFFIRDMQIKAHKWMTIKGYMVYTVVFFALMLAYNFLLTSFTNPVREYDAIVYVYLAVSFVISSYAYHVIYRGSGVKSWRYIAVGSVFGAVASVMIVMFIQCCGLMSLLESSATCAPFWEWSYRFANCLPFPCLGSVLPVMPFAVILYIIGGVFSFLGLYQMLRATETKHEAKNGQVSNRI
jgi:hypothetical protein